MEANDPNSSPACIHFRWYQPGRSRPDQYPFVAHGSDSLRREAVLALAQFQPQEHLDLKLQVRRGVRSPQSGEIQPHWADLGPPSWTPTLSSAEEMLALCGPEYFAQARRFVRSGAKEASPDGDISNVIPNDNGLPGFSTNGTLPQSGQESPHS